MVHERPGGRFVPGSWKKHEKERQEKLAAVAEASGVGDMSKKFSATSTKIEMRFTQATIGLQTKDEFKRKRETVGSLTLADIEAEEAAEREAEIAAARERAKLEARERAKKLVNKTKLSFGHDEHDEDEDGDGDAPQPPKKQKQSPRGSGEPRPAKPSASSSSKGSSSSSSLGSKQHK